MIVISPYAKKHYVSHFIYDHTSILRFVQARFNLPALPKAVEDPHFLNQCEDTERTHYSDEAATGK